MRREIQSLENQHDQDQESLAESNVAAQVLSGALEEAEKRVYLAEQEKLEHSRENKRLKADLELAQSKIFSLQPFSEDLTPDTLGRVSTHLTQTTEL